MFGDFGADRLLANDGVSSEVVDCGFDPDPDSVNADAGVPAFQDDYRFCTLVELLR